MKYTIFKHLLHPEDGENLKPSPEPADGQVNCPTTPNSNNPHQKEKENKMEQLNVERKDHCPVLINPDANCTACDACLTHWGFCPNQLRTAKNDPVLNDLMVSGGREPLAKRFYLDDTHVLDQGHPSEESRRSEKILDKDYPTDKLRTYILGEESCIKIFQGRFQSAEELMTHGTEITIPLSAYKEFKEVLSEVEAGLIAFGWLDREDD